MVVPTRAFHGIRVAGWVCAGLLAGAVAARAEGLSLESAGVRGGFSAESGSHGFHQAEVFGNWNLPWGWDLGREFHLQSRLDLSAGWLNAHDQDAAIGTLGPSLVVSRAQWPVSLAGGLSPTFLSTHEFGEDNLGTRVQFTSHIGLNLDFARHWRVGYRFQHMSNAGLSTPNPGLNMHMFALSYLF